MDRGQKDTEKLLKEVEARINKEYAEVIEEIEAELDDYLRRFEIKDKKWREWVESGEKTAEEYQKWRIGQMAVGKRWNDQKEIIARHIVAVNDDAKEKIKSICPEVYADNFNYSTYQVEKDAQVDTSFTLYSKESVERILKDDPDLLPVPGKKVSQQIAEGKAVRWNRQQIQSAMIQGIIRGESIPELATRLADKVGDSNRKAAIRNARTMATGAQNAGRVDAYKRAQSKGVELEQMWLATMDNRTRHSHRWLDREVRPVGEAFSNGCEYPGDPKGDPAEIYNCRCTLRGVVKGLERRSGQFRDTSGMDGMSYDEWRDAKPISQDILSQERKGEAVKRAYIREYGGRGGAKNINNSQQRYSQAIPSVKIDDAFSEKAKEQLNKYIPELMAEYESPLTEVIKGRGAGGGQEAGHVELDRLQMWLSNPSVENIFHEFAHTIASKKADDYGLTDNRDFWKEIKKVRTAYTKETSINQYKMISGYAKTSADEFMAEAFALAKMNEKGIEIPMGYSEAGLEFANKVLEIIGKYFRRK